MSKWVEIRDNIVKTLKVEEVTEELKNNVSKAIIDEVFPAIEDVVHGFADKVRNQAPNEKGWCKIRDGIVLPLIIEGLVYVAKTVLTRAMAEKG